MPVQVVADFSLAPSMYWSCQDGSERAGMTPLSFRPGPGQPRVPTCAFHVPICNWNQGTQGSVIFMGGKLQWFPLKSLFFSC